MTILTILQDVTRVIGVLFLLCYAYQMLYIPLAFMNRRKPAPAKKQHRYAVLISARNEEAVIGQLLDSIHRQDYPKELVTAFVVADNCTDGTARAAHEAGAVVYERFDQCQKGKGYALHFLLGKIQEDWGDVFDAYIVFDADNLLKPDYISRMNETFDEGHSIITSYRNSKNFGDNWVSAGYALWFLREAAFLNGPRSRLGISSVVMGTGFLFSRDIMHRYGGWPFHTLTEDTEFTAHSILQGERIAYCAEAEFYDEQPTQFRQSWRQRLRWAKGYIQVLRVDGLRLCKGIFSKNGPSCFDMLMSIFPAFFLTLCSVVVGTAATLLELALGGDILPLLATFVSSFAVPYVLLLLVGAMTTASQWRHIHARPVQKILYTFTFPLFMLTYIPISIAAIFFKVEWKPIEHKVAVSITELR